MCRSVLVAGWLLASCAQALAQAGSELFLVQLRSAHGRLSADSVQRLTNRAGYDNQPAFAHNGAYIFYTSIDSAGRADIWRFDLQRRVAEPVTRTQPESEYSATPMPQQNRFSVVRVEADSTQRLWSFAVDGSDPRLVLPHIKPVGYHAWLTADRLALFVLGSPATLQLADVRTGTVKTIGSNIGRALQVVPGRSAFTFVQRHADGTTSMVWYDLVSERTETLLPALPNEYHVWLADGTLISAYGSVLYQWRRGDRGWIFLADLSAAGITAMTRLAISADQRWLAVVAADPPGS